MSLVMVLNDGTTYTDLQGCKIIEINEDETDSQFVDEVVKRTALNDDVFGRFGRVITTFS